MPLIVIPTPVGNLSDITIRGLEELRRADIIACEDTRHTGILLKKYDISCKLISCHQHNEIARADEIMSYLSQGKNVALVSDAGTPGVSDPGYQVIKRAIEDGFVVDVLPGPTAVIPAILMSGLDPQPFTFFGFLPDKKGEREQVLGNLKDSPWTTVFYVSPHKISRHIESMLEVFGDRKAALVREISKIHQEALRGTFTEILHKVEEGLKGEIVLVVEGSNRSDQGRDWEEQAQRLLEAGLSHRDIVSVLSDTMGVPKNRSKKWLLDRK
ncbi:16S rRNA (cytidine(1402)-2'-O)-methyltransferase [Dethiosulfovibrio salsuginis]|uniref:Ribosomal RNA small subunit methyltransferase I n=1 Tax=Dethiosulfovibrio salsuginis TaxID=561720 RepID=A0A1X7JB23_9BACT|nr:16S rRNA (cytidine(1402)-2'-O)-methyltransferase [Dethiosulfovibrio salsuginis]SMG24264.1 16S rRNA (cytidine1402-2'-O)-methyltransferase [Dethiosulfovibrio salsuginis]